MADETKDASKPGLAGRAGRGVLKVVLGEVFGIALLFGGFFVLVWGEARVNIAIAIGRADNLNEAPDVGEGSPVTYRGSVGYKVAARDGLLQGDFAVVRRRIHVCGVVEKKVTDKSGGESFEYEQKWLDADSSLLKEKFATPSYNNPAPIDAAEAKTEAVAEGLSVGDYELSTVSDFMSLELIVPPVSDFTKSELFKARKQGDEWVYEGDSTACEKDAKTPAARIGDKRVQFQVLRKNDLVTTFGMRKGQHIDTFRKQLVVIKGSRDELVDKMKSARQSKTWMFRAAGALVLWIALFLIINPALKLVTWIPIIGSLVKGAATLVTFLAAGAGVVAFVFFGIGMKFFTKLFGGLIG